jgi:predicted TIM-barrel fold metal-dependent hydrolase
MSAIADTHTAASTEGKGSEKMLIIDTDVHEPCPDIKSLLPYLPTKWHRFINDYNWNAHVQPMPHVLTHKRRGEWEDISSLEALRRNLLDDKAIDIGILNGDPTLQFSGLSGWYDVNTAYASAYNDWQLAEWLDVEPRLRGAVHVIAHDPVQAAKEIDRIGAHPSIVQVFLPIVVDRLYGDPMYRPIFEAAVRNDLAVAMHHGPMTKTATGYANWHIEWHIGIPQAAMSQLTSMLCGGVFDALPDLRLVILETGFTWVPHWMMRADQHYRELRNEIPWVKKLPSAIFREQVRVATQPMEEMTKDDLLQFNALMKSDELLVFATDYPHWDSDEPMRVLPPGLDPDLQRKIMGANAIQTYPRLRTQI